MDILQAMKDKLSPLGLYDLSEGTLVSAELECFAEELQRVSDELDGLLQERFVSTASGRGLEVYEDMMGLMCLDQTLAGRRSSILGAMAIKNTDNRLSDMDKLKPVFGVHGTFSQSAGALSFDCTDSLTPAQSAALEAQMGAFAPLGVNFTIT